MRWLQIASYTEQRLNVSAQEKISLKWSIQSKRWLVSRYKEGFSEFGI